MASGKIRAGIGGWTYAPWRGLFYPSGLPHAQELEHASRQLTCIEINGTFYRTQSAATFEKWRDETPDDFMFTVKASRATTNRRVLAEAQQSIDWFLASGVTRLGAKLGPILWQFAPTKKFDPVDFAAFLALLPTELDGIRLRHAIDVRHASFASPELIQLARTHRVAIVFADTDDYPSVADVTADFVYARLMRAQAEIVTGYSLPALDRWAAHAATWAAGGDPETLPHVTTAEPGDTPRDVFVFAINGAKERAPAAAVALIERVDAGAATVSGSKRAATARPPAKKTAARVKPR